MGWMAGGTTGAFPAGSKRNNDLVARADPNDLSAGGFNDARAFMPEHRWKLQAEHSVTRGYVSMANTARYKADERFVLPGAVEIDILKQESGAWVGRHGSTGTDSHGR
jgi:hypothetical protein